MVGMRKRAKLLFARACGQTRLTDVWTRARERLDPAGRCAILLYHRVVPRDELDSIVSLPGIVVTAESFEAQMRYLRGNTQVLTQDEFLAALASGRFPRRSVFITFDDGWEDNVLHAYPILKAHGLAATIFLTSGFMGTDRMFWQERMIWLFRQAADRVADLERVFREQGLEAALSQLRAAARQRFEGKALQSLIQRLAREPPGTITNLIQALDAHVGGQPFPLQHNRLMDWAQARSMGGGGISFGSHGVHHHPMPRSEPADLEEELRASKDAIKTNLGGAIDTLAYPGGEYDERVVRAAAAAGYRAAFTLRPGLCGAGEASLRLPRINLHEERVTDERGVFCPDLFAVRLAGWL